MLSNGYVSGAFVNYFHRAAREGFFAPGRVNLIGEHIDYNGGYVFPYALHIGVHCAIAVRNDRALRLFSENYPDAGVREYDLDDLRFQGCWADYPVSVVKTLQALGYKPENGCDIFICADLPDGAGLSSSAALEVAFAKTLRRIFGFPLTDQEIAFIGKFAENHFIGVNCGIMDQFVSAMAQPDRALLLNTAALDYEYVPLKNAAVVVVNTGIRHALAASAYNTRRRECESACGAIGVSALCSLSPQEFDARSHLITDAVCRKRAHHAVYENDRVLRAADAMKQGDLARFGELMNESHASLKEDYEVSCEELDFLAETAQKMPGVYGARMTGGGFGGCTVNLVEPTAVKRFVSDIQAAYESRFGVGSDVYL